MADLGDRADLADIVEQRRIDVGGVALNVATAGPPDDARHTVLMLHGFPDRWQLWRHQIAALAAAGHRVVAPDLPGFGDSDRPVGVDAYRMPRLVRDVAGLLDALDVDQVSLVGHDWGAALAWSVTGSLPRRVERLVAVSVGHGAASAAAGVEQRALSWYMLWFLFPGVAERVLPARDWAFFREWAWGGAPSGADEDADRQVADLSRPGALTAALNWYRANIDPEHFVRIEGPATARAPIACPVTGVWSSGDPFLTEAQMTGSARLVSGPWRYERIEGAGHWIPVQAPRRLNEILLDVLSR